MFDITGKRNDGRVYHILRALIIIITVLAGISAAYYGHTLNTEAAQKEWREYCRSYHQDLSEFQNCMMLSFKMTEKFRKLLWINLAIAIVLPSSFFAFVSLYRYLKEGRGLP